MNRQGTKDAKEEGGDSSPSDLGDLGVLAVRILAQDGEC